MKTLIFFTPRSKSTVTQEILTKKFNMESMVDPFVHSKIKIQNTSEFPKIIQTINQSQNTCVKVSSSDFLDSKTRCVLDCYKDIDYNSFDNIVFITRNDVLSAALSFSYMDGKNKDSWHKRKGETKIAQPCAASLERVLYLLRSYRVYDLIKTYITKNYSNPTFYEYEFNNVYSLLKTDFNLTDNDFDTNLVDNDLDYSALIENYTEVDYFVKDHYDIIMSVSDSEINEFDSKFWMFYLKRQSI